MYYLLWIVAICLLPWWITVLLLFIAGHTMTALVVLVISLLINVRGLK